MKQHNPDYKNNTTPHPGQHRRPGPRPSVLRLPALLAKIPMSRTWIYEKIKADEFPAPIQLGAKAIAWLEDEIDEWLANRVAASRTISGSVH